MFLHVGKSKGAWFEISILIYCTCYKKYIYIYNFYLGCAKKNYMVSKRWWKKGGGIKFGQTRANVRQTKFRKEIGKYIFLLQFELINV